MPKRSATSPEVSPRKLIRKSRSPIKTSKPILPVDPDPALMNIISDEEIDEPSPSSSTQDKLMITRFTSSNELRELREKFFNQFLNDITSSDIGSIDVEVYRKLQDELPEEDHSERVFLVDQYMKDFVLEKILSQRERWSNFLQLSIHLSREHICTPSVPISLISDLIELSTLQDCESIFEYVEKQLDIWKEPIFLNSGKNAVLRMCNDLLRRLSRAQNTIFCGRILIFLANYFPFSERSGLNIMSEFNAENVTSYKAGDGSDDPEDKMEIVEESDDKLFEGMDISIPGLEQIVSITQEEKKKKVKVDYNLYVKFWSLQDFFRNPVQCYNKVSWKTFTLYTQDVLSAFTCFKIEGSVPASSTNSDDMPKNHSHSSINFIPKLGDEDLYFPKYLTNRRLLELQMGDPNFRRYFMVQLLIILQYLTTSVKFKSESQILSEEQLDFVKKTSEKIYYLLKEIRPGGKEFVKTVHHVLKREDLWSKWKNDGCQPFKKPTKSLNVEAKADNQTAINDDLSQIECDHPAQPTKPRELGDILQEADENNKFELGNPELTRLWNICGDNLEACRSESRSFLPSIETYFAEAFKELDPEPTPPAVLADPSKREIKHKKLLSNANFGWRALRLLARNSPFFFQLVQSPPIQPLQNYLEYILKKIAAELEVPPKEEGQDVKPETLPKDSQQSNSITEVANGKDEGDQVMEGSTDETDELLKTDLKEDNVVEEGEEGEVNEYVRNLTDTERRSCGKLLGSHWKELALKFQFEKHEIEYFEAEHKTNAGAYMLQVWTEQEKEDANVADLLYRLEGLKLRHLVKDIFPDLN